MNAKLLAQKVSYALFDKGYAIVEMKPFDHSVNCRQHVFKFSFVHKIVTENIGDKQGVQLHGMKKYVSPQQLILYLEQLLSDANFYNVIVKQMQYNVHYEVTKYMLQRGVY